MLWELSVSEQRHRAVLEVLAGVPVMVIREPATESGTDSLSPQLGDE
jgi:hypothetical protein